MRYQVPLGFVLEAGDELVERALWLRPDHRRRALATTKGDVLLALGEGELGGCSVHGQSDPRHPR